MAITLRELRERWAARAWPTPPAPALTEREQLEARLRNARAHLGRHIGEQQRHERMAIAECAKATLMARVVADLERELIALNDAERAQMELFTI